MKRLLLISLTLLILLGLPAVALAHPMGAFSINRYSHLTVHSDQLELFYIVDMAEIPTFQRQEKLQNPGTYLASVTPELTANLMLNQTTPQWEVVNSDIEFLDGQGGLQTMRIELTLTTAVKFSEDETITYSDSNFDDRQGWREIVLVAADGVNLASSSVPTEDVSQQLTEFPSDQANLNVTSATFALGEKSLFALPTASFEGSSAFADNSTDHFAQLINTSLTDPITILFVFLAAFGWGAAHALTPGHGKTIVAAYLVGSRGTVRHAMFLGLTTTITHTAGVFALGLLTLFASRYIVPEQLYPWLGLMSGLLVLSIGWTMLRLRWQKSGHQHHHHDPTHPHHHHAHEHDHDHNHPHHVPDEISWRSLLALGVSGGLLPCPSALIVMLSAIALGRVGFGLLLIITFSLGLAGVLTGIGIAWVKARSWLDWLAQRRPQTQRTQTVIFRVAPVVSALFIVIAGAIISFRALLETGLL